MTKFDKPALAPDEHIGKLKDRGLSIPDEQRARRYLANISYFRLSAYTRPLYVPNETPHRFLHGTSFDDVLMLYVFDRELRLLLLDAIERLEVALRAQLTNTLAERYGSHGYLNPAIFDTRYNHAWIIDKLKEEAQAREVEVFLAHYREKYTAAPLQPPIWMAMERIREIRASERRFYQKITDIYATAMDYNAEAETTQAFFATVQNKLHFAIHGRTISTFPRMRESRKLA